MEGTLPCLNDPLPGAGALRDLVSDTTPDGRSSAAATRPPRVHPRRGRRRCARGAGASAPPAPRESVDGWPLATPDTRFLGGAAPWDPPFAGVVHGVRTLHPRAVCRSQPPPERVARLDSCVRTGAEGLRG